MIYLEISDSAGQKHIDLMGTYSISEVISMISEAVGDEDTESSETEEDSEDSEESSEDSEKERQQMIVEARILHNIALKRYGD